MLENLLLPGMYMSSHIWTCLYILNATVHKLVQFAYNHAIYGISNVCFSSFLPHVSNAIFTSCLAELYPTYIIFISPFPDNWIVMYVFVIIQMSAISCCLWCCVMCWHCLHGIVVITLCISMPILPVCISYS